VLPAEGSKEEVEFRKAHQPGSALIAYRIVALPAEARRSLLFSLKPDSWACSIWGATTILESYPHALKTSEGRSAILITKYDRACMVDLSAISDHPHEFEVVVPPCEYDFLSDLTSPDFLWNELLEHLQSMICDVGPAGSTFVCDAEIQSSPLFRLFEKFPPGFWDPEGTTTAGLKAFSDALIRDITPSCLAHFRTDHPSSAWGPVSEVDVFFVSALRPFGS
jgi:hypothetical protein